MNRGLKTQLKVFIVVISTVKTVFTLHISRRNFFNLQPKSGWLRYLQNFHKRWVISTLRKQSFTVYKRCCENHWIILNLCYLICGRDLHTMVQATSNPSPSSHSSHIFKFTDLSAPLSNESNMSFESPLKKRRIGNSEVECSTPPVSFTSESTHTQVHKIVKNECEELIELIVLLLILIPYLYVHSDSIQDQAKLWITLSLSK